MFDSIFLNSPDEHECDESSNGNLLDGEFVIHPLDVLDCSLVDDLAEEVVLAQNQHHDQGQIHVVRVGRRWTDSVVQNAKHRQNLKQKKRVNKSLISKYEAGREIMMHDFS